MPTPKIIVRAHYYDLSSEGRDFYSSLKKNDYIGYIDTGIKTAGAKDYMDYADNPEKSSGVFNPKGLLTQEEKKEVRKELRETKSTIWDCVISFEEKYGKENVSDWRQAQNLLKRTMAGFLKEAGLNPDNVEYIAGLHENTDNRHIHLQFWERNPQHYDCRKKTRIYRHGKLPLKAIDYFKGAIFKHFLTPVESAKRIRKIMTEETSKAVSGDFKNDFNGFSFYIRKLFEEIPVEGDLGYASRNMDSCRKDIDNATEIIVMENEGSQSWRRLKQEMKIHDDQVIEYCSENNLDATNLLFQINFNSDLKRRMGNVLIKEIVKMRKEEKDRLVILHHPKARMRCHQSYLTKVIAEAIFMNDKVDKESRNVFDDFQRRLKEAEYQRLAEEGKIDVDGNENEM